MPKLVEKLKKEHDEIKVLKSVQTVVQIAHWVVLVTSAIIDYFCV